MQIQATLNLSQGFGQCGQIVDFKESLFPAGECYINVSVPFGIEAVRINTRLNNSDDIMGLAMAVDALKRRGVDYIELFAPYLPYSRQDRVCKPGESFSLKVMCDFLWGLGVNRIVTYDVHSDIAKVFLDGLLVNYNNHREVIDFIEYLSLVGNPLVLVCPDQGATKKTYELLSKFPQLFKSVLFCHKQRQQDGSIKVAEIVENIRDMTAIVVDDICDGGATFVELGKRLQEAKARQSYLFVSHGIFSNGQEQLLPYYRMIGTTNSIRNGDGEGVKLFKLNY
jgi:ribose-phosphate pyrophosphokinase